MKLTEAAALIIIAVVAGLIVAYVTGGWKPNET